MISIIVPVYNVSEYLRRALDSILAQTYEAWEAILVDDGSTDSSPAILEEYARKDARFKVIHQPNGGVSAARNTGLDNANGEYVAWIDPDDVAHPDMLQKLIDAVCPEWKDSNYLSNNASGGNDLTNRNQIPKRIGISNAPAASGRTMALIAMLREDGVHSYLWDKIFDRRIFEENHIRFPGGLRYEDVRILPSLILAADEVVTISDNLYDYTIREDSITGATRRGASEEFFSALRFRCDNLKNTEFYAASRYGLYRHLRRMVYELRVAKEDKEFAAELTSEAREIYKEIKKNLHGKEKIIAAVFNASPALYRVIRGLTQ